jgi:hypothetical protein
VILPPPNREALAGTGGTPNAVVADIAAGSGVRDGTARRGAELWGAARWYAGEPEMAASLDYVRAGHSWSERGPPSGSDWWRSRR